VNCQKGKNRRREKWFESLLLTGNRKEERPNGFGGKKNEKTRLTSTAGKGLIQLNQEKNFQKEEPANPLLERRNRRKCTPHAKGWTQSMLIEQRNSPHAEDGKRKI